MISIPWKYLGAVFIIALCIGGVWVWTSKQNAFDPYNDGLSPPPTTTPPEDNSTYVYPISTDNPRNDPDHIVLTITSGTIVLIVFGLLIGLLVILFRQRSFKGGR
jgi:hypothetical protein